MNTIRRVLAALVAVAGILAVGAALAPPATANVLTSIRYVDAYPGQPNGGGAFRATVACPAGMYVVSAGASNMVIRSLSPISPAVPSQHLANFTAVLVTGTPSYPDTSNPFLNPVVHAACAPASRLSGAVSVTTQGAPGVTSGTARCPAGLRAFGGGAYYLAPDGHFSTSGQQVDEDSLSSDGQAWTFRGSSTNVRNRLIVTTQCAPLAGSYVATATALSGHDFVYVKCFSGYLPLSGGARMVTSQNADSIGQTTGVLTEPDDLLVHGFGYYSPVTARAQCVPTSLF